MAGEHVICHQDWLWNGNWSDLFNETTCLSRATYVQMPWPCSNWVRLFLATWYTLALIHYVLFAQNLTTLVRMFYCVVMWGANSVCTYDRTWFRTLHDHCEPCMYKCKCRDRTPPCAELIEVFKTLERRSMREAWPVARKHFDWLQRSVGRIWDRPNRPIVTLLR